MEERKRIIYIILVMSSLVFCIGIFSNILLYRTYFEETKNHLADTVKVLANLTEFQSGSENGSANRNNLITERIDSAIQQYERLNRKMEITVALREGATIHFIAALRHRGHAVYPTVIGIHSGKAEPMRRALEGKSGIMVGKDYHGQTVLAAYEYAPGLKLGIVSKIDLSEIRAPFIRAGFIIISVSMLIILLGIAAVSRISNPIIIDLEKKAESLACANEDLARANEEMDAANEELQAAMEEMEQTNEEMIRSQEELAQSENRIRILLDVSPIGIITADRETRHFVYANPSACAMFGYNCDEMLTMGTADIHPAGELEMVIAEFQALADNKYKSTPEIPCLKKDGTLFYADISAAPVEFDGRPCLLGQFSDVTERKRAEAALRESEEQFAKAFHFSPISIAISFANDGKYIDVNKEFLDLTGYTRDEVIGRTSDDLGLWTDPEQENRVHREVDGGGQVHDRQVEIRSRNGNILSVLYSAVPITIHGAPCLIKSVIDITDRRRAEESLKNSEERYRRITESITDYIYTVQIEDGKPGRTVHGSACIAVTGYTAGELADDPYLWIAMVHPDDRQAVQDHVERILREKWTGPLEHRIFRKDVTMRWVRNTPVPYYDVAGTFRSYDGIIVDITERREAEEALRIQKEMAQLYLDIAGVVIVAIGADQKVTLINRKGCEVLGYSAEQIVGNNWFDMFIHENIREEVRSVFIQMMRGEVPEVEYYENSVLTSSGDERIIAWHNTLLMDASGVTTGSLSSGEDITERKKSEDDLRNQLALNMALAGISGSVISKSFTMSEMAYMVLEYARLLSDSEHGFVSEIDPDTGDNIELSMTQMIDDNPSMGKEGIVIFKKGADGLYPGLWGHALNTRREFYTNEPGNHPASRAIPEGHLHITRFLSVPVLFGGTLVGQIALANSARDYTDADLTMTRRLGSIYSMAIVRLRNDNLLVKSLEEKTVLIKELHHRVKNNMQVVSSLISLQARKIDDEKYRSIFMESSNRIQAMAMVHEKIYHSGDMSRVDFSLYVREIAERLLSSHSTERGQVALDVDVRDIFLGIDEAIPCGIIINELVTNALKHAFPAGRRGKLAISFLKDSEGRRTLVVRDDGRGIPDDVFTSPGNSLGMQIVSALVRQLNGTISADGANGTRIEIVF